MCAALAPEMTFTTHEHLGAQVHERSGNREEFCALLEKVMPILAKKMTSYNVTRTHFTATRHGLHWLTADISYGEQEDLVFTNGMHLKQEDELHLTMEKTLDGLRVTHLEVESRVLPPS
jgi:hypothetical protein